MIYAARGSLLLPDAADTEKGSGERREQGETPALSRQPSMRPAAPKGLGQGHERPESSREVEMDQEGRRPQSCLASSARFLRPADEGRNPSDKEPHGLQATAHTQLHSPFFLAAGS
ncbi:unnamed protein product [Prorocentrum cordatum]|uniref:Uncharacterized protein n=1 Tax=Prorocentrum cordatum TaxID=2364126 RepID=A0ABN9TWT3_9DINO|nr:unnamed protein product [Polarella glacialis]